MLYQRSRPQKTGALSKKRSFAEDGTYTGHWLGAGRLATWSGDRVFRVWDVKKGEVVAGFAGGHVLAVDPKNGRVVLDCRSDDVKVMQLR